MGSFIYPPGVTLSSSPPGYQLINPATGQPISLVTAGTVGFPLGTTLAEDAANILALRNGTNNQTFRVYSSYTNASNGAWLDIAAVASGYLFSPNANGTGNPNLFLQFGLLYGGVRTPFLQLGGINGRTSFTPITAGGVDLGTNGGSGGFGKLFIDYTNTATVGAVTINKAAGRVNIGAGNSSVVVTDSFVGADSHVFLNLQTVDATAKSCQATCAAGSFTITLNAACTGQVAIDFLVVSAST